MTRLPRLNLPDYPVKVVREGEALRIRDDLRGKYVALTPEEYVRQRFTAWLIRDLHYPAPLMNNEIALDINGTRRRCDTLVFDRDGSHFMVVEYKAPEVRITQDVFDQIARYNMVLRARYLVVSNGLSHFCCLMDYEARTYHFVPEIPDFTLIHHSQGQS